MKDSALSRLLRRVFGWSVLLTLCLAPTQWTLIRNPRLGPADLLLAFSAGVLGLEILLRRDWPRLRAALPHWSHLLFVLCAGASCLVAADHLEAIKELIQLIEYFIVAVLVFKAFLLYRAEPVGCDAESRAQPTIKLLLTLLALITGVILALAAVQYLWPQNQTIARIFVEPKPYDIIVNVLGGTSSPLLVAGTFGSRNILGGFLALALPICFVGLIGGAPSWLRRLGCALLLLAGFAINLCGASHWAVIGVIGAIAALRGARWFLPVAAALILWQAAIMPHCLPRENDLRHYESLALYDSTGQPERRYPEWQAAAAMILTNPWLGVGLGNYQEQIGQYFDQVPNATGPAEPDIQNLYLVLAASCGLPTLFAFMALLVAALTSAARASRLGVAGALAAFALTAVWHPLLVRGLGIPLAFVLALAYAGTCRKVNHGH